MLRPLLLSIFVCASAPAFAIFKCESGGKVTYSDTNCSGGRVLDVNGAPATDAPKAVRQAEQEKKSLKRLESEQRKQTAQEDRARQRIARTEAMRRQKCTSLERRQRWADEDAAHATGKSAERAKRKARHATEQYQDECRTLSSRGINAMR
jgi:hypothetical protein